LRHQKGVGGAEIWSRLNAARCSSELDRRRGETTQEIPFTLTMCGGLIALLDDDYDDFTRVIYNWWTDAG
jgi:hypothetical protein